MSGTGAWLRKVGIYGYGLIGLSIVIAAFFVFEHRAHLAPYLTYIILAVFVGLHLVMHLGGHGTHSGSSGGGCGWDRHAGGGTPGTGKNETDRTEKSGKDGGCH